MEKYLQGLSKVYNNLLLVHTCGEDSFLMTDCMRTFYDILTKMVEEQQKEE